MGKMQDEFANGGPGQAPPQPPPQQPPSASAADQSYQQMMQNRVDQMQPPPGPAGAGSGGGSYKVDPNEAQALIGDWDKVIKKIDDCFNTGQGMLEVGPQTAAGEHASAGWTTAAKNSAQAYLDHNRAMRAYAVEQRKKLTDALNAYKTHDQNSADAFKSKHA